MSSKAFMLIVTLMFVSFTAACSQPASEPAKTESAKTDNQPTKKPGEAVPAVNPDSAGGHGANSNAEVPAAVKAAFPEAQTINMQHKELTANQAGAIEKDYGLKVKPTDFHTYVAYGTTGGKRAQLGAATLVDVEGAGEPIQLMVVYDNSIVIKKISTVKGNSDVVAPAFLDQFAGKDHDQSFQLGKDIKYQGSNQAAAEAVTKAIKGDILSMQMLYGKAHSH